MSRVLPFLEADSFSVGIRIRTGKDRSYRRVVLRSWTPAILPYTPRTVSRGRVPFFELSVDAARRLILLPGASQGNARTQPEYNVFLVLPGPRIVRCTLNCQPFLVPTGEFSSAPGAVADFRVRGVSRLNCRIL